MPTKPNSPADPSGSHRTGEPGAEVVRLRPLRRPTPRAVPPASPSDGEDDGSDPGPSAA